MTSVLTMTLWAVWAGVFLVLLVVIVGLVFERLAERADARRYPAPGVMVDIGGRRLNLICAGQGSPTVVLEAGGGNFAAMLQPLQSRVARFTQVCAYDRAGLGWSDPAPAGRSLDARADDLHALLANRGIEGPYVLVGHSMGGLLVRAFARRHPDQVVGMVLVDAAEEKAVFDGLPVVEAASQAYRRNGLLARFGGVRMAIRAKVRAAKGQSSLPDPLVDAIASRMVRSEYWRAALDETSAYAATPMADRGEGGFGGLGATPLIVIRHGRPFTGALAALELGWTEGQARLARLSSRSRLIVAEGAGHDIPTEQPDLVAQAVLEVVEAVRAGGL